MWIKDLSTSQVKEGFIKNFLSQIKANISAAYEVSSKKTMYIFQGTLFYTLLQTHLKFHDDIYSYHLKSSLLQYPSSVLQMVRDFLII